MCQGIEFNIDPSPCSIFPLLRRLVRIHAKIRIVREDHAALQDPVFACSLGWLCFGSVNPAHVPFRWKHAYRWQRYHRASLYGGMYAYRRAPSIAHPRA